MLIAALILFVIAIVLGILVLSYILQNQPTPKFIAVLHGVIAAFALVVVIIYLIINHTSLPVLGITVLIIAALGGLFLFASDVGQHRMPKWVIIWHPIIAIIGLILLIYFFMSN